MPFGSQTRGSEQISSPWRRPLISPGQMPTLSGNRRCRGLPSAPVPASDTPAHPPGIALVRMRRPSPLARRASGIALPHPMWGHIATTRSRSTRGSTFSCGMTSRKETKYTAMTRSIFHQCRRQRLEAACHPGVHGFPTNNVRNAVHAGKRGASDIHADNSAGRPDRLRRRGAEDLSNTPG